MERLSSQAAGRNLDGWARGKQKRELESMISLVIPIYNEEEIIRLLHATVVAELDRLDEDYEIVYVNDGSQDRSLELLREIQAADGRVVVVELSRNWGHMGALAAGLGTARGDGVILMDGDLQDPAEVIPELVQAWRGGAQVVTAVRRSREEHRKVLALLFPLFYRVLGAVADFPIPLNAGIFGLLDRKAVDAINGLREYNRYLPGLRAWVGYRTAIVYYERRDRVGGEGKLTFLSRIKYAMDAITSFSYKPLRFSFVLSAFSILAGAVLGITTIFRALTDLQAVAYAISASVFLMGGLLLLSLGLLGEYVGRVYDEVRGRPLSLINAIYRSPRLLSEPLEPEALLSSATQRQPRVFPAA
jgi:polyisoprenyl-phosphate glycosyltransferase